LKDYEKIVVYAMGIGRKALKQEALGINNGVDILIATPDRFLVHHNAGTSSHYQLIHLFVHQFEPFHKFRNTFSQ
jgi:superfamily II DNA/RNA helicase